MPYHRFTDDEGEHGSFETFWVTEDEVKRAKREDRDNPVFTAPGWHWWACFPGCLPDGEPMGPFDTEEEAIADANS